MITPDIRIALVTALAVESAAARLMVDDPSPILVHNDPNLYVVGQIPSRGNGLAHKVVLARQTRDGTRDAATIASDLARSFPTLVQVVMCGIAGGIPDPSRPERHVRLGDVVTSAGGLVDYGNVRWIRGFEQVRRHVEGISPVLLAADRELEAKEILGNRPWLGLVERWSTATSFRRPTEVADIDSPSPSEEEGPRIHRSTIGSADQLLRDAVRRDYLARRYGVRAVEMEGSGIAAGANLHGVGWYMVRGIADYCDVHKDDSWHGYAALAAAAYTRALLEELPSLRGTHDTEGRLARLSDVVEALLAIPVIQDDHQRRALLATLPSQIRTQIADHLVARLHVISVVQTCERFPNGVEALLGALRLALGEQSAEVERVAVAIANYCV